MGLGLPSMLALVLAICLTVMRRRHQPIVIFCMLNVLLLSLALIWENDSMEWVYGTVSMFVPAWWFTVGRWRNKDEAALAAMNLPSSLRFLNPRFDISTVITQCRAPRHLSWYDTGSLFLSERLALLRRLPLINHHAGMNTLAAM